MMRPLTGFSMVLGTLAFLATGQAEAQYGVGVGRPGGTFGTPYGNPMAGLPYGPPTLSPYLLLNSRGFGGGVGNPGLTGSIALNYYNLVRPQVAFSNAILTLQQEQNLLAQQQLTTTAGIEGDLAALTPTGHRFGYFTQSRFFMNNTRGGFGTGVGAGGTRGTSFLAGGGGAGGIGGTGATGGSSGSTGGGGRRGR
jgi:hypothetical protein